MKFWICNEIRRAGFYQRPVTGNKLIRLIRDLRDLHNRITRCPLLIRDEKHQLIVVFFGCRSCNSGAFFQKPKIIIIKSRFFLQLFNQVPEICVSGPLPENHDRP
jgi:hypothetical protein